MCIVLFVPSGSNFITELFPTISSCLSHLSAESCVVPSMDSCLTGAFDGHRKKDQENFSSHILSLYPSYSWTDPETEILLTSDAPPKLLGNRSSRPRTITIVSCFVAPGKLIITGLGSNLFVFGSDSKRLSAGFTLVQITACRTRLSPQSLSPHSLSAGGWGLSHERSEGREGCRDCFLQVVLCLDELET